jgi:hypothetical protein
MLHILNIFHIFSLTLHHSTTHSAGDEQGHRLVCGSRLLLHIGGLHGLALATLEHSVFIFLWLLLDHLLLGFLIPKIPYLFGVEGVWLEFTTLDPVQKLGLVVVANRVDQRSHPVRVEAFEIWVFPVCTRVVLADDCGVFKRLRHLDHVVAQVR